MESPQNRHCERLKPRGNLFFMDFIESLQSFWILCYYGLLRRQVASQRRVRWCRIAIASSLRDLTLSRRGNPQIKEIKVVLIFYKSVESCYRFCIFIDLCKYGLLQLFTKPRNDGLGGAESLKFFCRF